MVGQVLRLELVVLLEGLPSSLQFSPLTGKRSTARHKSVISGFPLMRPSYVPLTVGHSSFATKFTTSALDSH